MTTPRRDTARPVGNALRRVGRALRLRCPGCGSPKMLRSWLATEERCPSCELLSNRGEHDYFLGAMMFNLVAAELTAVVSIGGVIVGTWPDPPWTLVTYGGAALMVVAPIAFYPFAKLLWLAIDLTFRPGKPGHRPD